MKSRPKEPSLPAERHETLRRLIIELIDGRALSAKEISGYSGMSVKEVSEHLDHIRRTLNTKTRRLRVVPAECRKCGFVFRKRDRLSKPGRCPVCKGEMITEPLFEIGGAGREGQGNRE